MYQYYKTTYDSNFTNESVRADDQIFYDSPIRKKVNGGNPFMGQM